MSIEVSGLVIAKNEAADLPEALLSWEPVCDEIIVVNDNSTDATANIARRFGAKVINTCMDSETGFAGLRNTGLEATQTSHSLIFDADERPSAEILHSIKQSVQGGRENVVYRLLRRNNAFNGWLDHGRFSPDWQTRMFPSSARYQGLVHEVPVFDQEVEVQDLKGIVEHYTYQSLSEYARKMRSYAGKSALGTEPPTIPAILRVGADNLIKHEGYKDGWRGIAMAFGDMWQESLIRKSAIKSKQSVPQQSPQLHRSTLQV